jgi:hypothetical protein
MSGDESKMDYFVLILSILFVIYCIYDTGRVQLLLRSHGWNFVVWRWSDVGSFYFFLFFFFFFLFFESQGQIGSVMVMVLVVYACVRYDSCL